MNHIEWTIPLTDKATAEILIAELSEVGFEGFEEGPGFLKAYAPQWQINPAAEAVLAGKGLQKTEVLLAPQNWNAEWESSFEPVELDRFCRIRAHFHPPAKDLFAHEIVITPKMSFGTGHHATTRMMMSAMQKTALTGRRVLDFGAGTGVLAILSEQLGATAVTALENDPSAVENCQENVDTNNCRHIKVRCGSLEIMAAECPFGVILANINRNILLQYLPQMSTLLAAGGEILVSGILKEDAALLQGEFYRHSFRFTEALQEDNWACLRFKKD